jgi:hypothetical protein
MDEMGAVPNYVKNMWSGVSVGARGALGRTNWAVIVRHGLILSVGVAALSVYAVLNRYDYLQTREYSDGGYNLLRFDRLRGRLEECIVPGIDGTFLDRTRDEATCVAFRANTAPADRIHGD